MRILFDHCTPRPLKRLLERHEIRTAFQMGWADKDNGDLLRVAEAQFDLIITTDKRIRYQQNLKGRRIAILVIPQVLRIVLEHRNEFVNAVNLIGPGDYCEFSWEK